MFIHQLDEALKLPTNLKPKDILKAGNSMKPGGYVRVSPAAMPGEPNNIEDLLPRNIPLESYRYYKMIQRYCSKYVAAVQSTRRFLYRGTNPNSKYAYLSKSRDSRRPMDTSRKEQVLIDKMLKTAGFNALRGNSIFTSSNENTARDYGMSVFLVAPFNTSSITWSSKILDMYSAIDNLDGTLQGYLEYKDILAPDPKLKVLDKNYEKFQRRVEKLLEYKDWYRAVAKLGYLKTDEYICAKIADLLEDVWSGDEDEGKTLARQQQALMKVFEHLRKASSALLKDLKEFFPGLHGLLKMKPLDTETKILSKSKEIVKSLGFVAGDLEGALRSRNEVYVSGWYFLLPYASDDEDMENETNSVMNLILWPKKLKPQLR